jgi:hypothetical protein
MKKRNRPVEVADLDPVAYLGEDLVLYIDSEDDNVPDTLCVQANYGLRRFDRVQPLGTYLGTNTYHPVLDVDARISNRQRILDEMPPGEVEAMLSDFTRKKLQNVENIVPLSEQYPGWQAGG